MSLKKAYLYLVSAISLIIVIVGAIMLLNLLLRAWVFPKADQVYYSSPCPSPVGSSATSTGCNKEIIQAQQQQDQANRTAQREGTAAQAVSMLIVAIPVWYYHWRLAKREV